VRAEALVAELQRRLLTLIAASGTIFASPRVEDVLRATLNLADELMPADGYAIWRSDAAGAWRIAASADLSDEFTRRLVQAADESGDGLLLEPLVVEDVYTTPRVEAR